MTVLSPDIPAAVSLGALWLPIVLSAVLSFVGSSVIWMAFKYHDAQWQTVPDEPLLMDAVRKAGLTRGMYMFPHMEPKPADRAAAQKTWAERYAKGPVGVVLLGTPGTMGMGPRLAKTFVFFLVVSFFVAYIAAHALGQGALYLKVFQIVGATAFVAYGAAPFMDSIWFYRSWRTTWLNVLDALIYGCLTAGAFGWLWPR
jgi:hypothetical protein